jgi:hypothetical protein
MNVVPMKTANETSATPRARTLREPPPPESTGFGSLLAELHLVAPPSLGAPVLPESQMFEAPRHEGDDRSQIRDARSDPRPLSGEPDQSRTDVRARRAAQDSPSRSAEPIDQTPLKTSPARGASPRAGEAGAEHARRPVSPDADAKRSPMEPEARRSQAVSASSKESTAAARSSIAQPVASTQRAAAATEVRPADQSIARIQSAAKSIGRVLGAPQSSSTESARATGAGQAAPDQGKTAAAKRTTPSESPPKQSAPREATRESAFARMVRSLRIRPGSRNSSASIRLDPPRLGRMNVHVRMSGERISIDVRTETSEARELVTARAMELRSALERHGLQVERFDVRGDLIEAGAADRPLGPRTDERDRDASASSKRESRRHAVESTVAASDGAPAPEKDDAADGDDPIASSQASARARQRGETVSRRERVDVRV